MRTATNKVIKLAENGILDWETIARECLQEMSEDDVADMASTCEWLDDEEDDDNEDDDNEDEDDEDDDFVGKAHVKVLSNGKEFLLDIDDYVSDGISSIEDLHSCVRKELANYCFADEDELEDGIEIINEQSLCERLGIDK